MNEGQFPEIEVAAEDGDEHTRKRMHGKGVYNDSNTVELPRLEQPNQKGKSSDGGNISRENNQQIQVKEAD